MPSVLDEHNLSTSSNNRLITMDKATIDHFPRAPSGMHDALNDDTLDEYQDHL